MPSYSLFQKEDRPYKKTIINASIFATKKHCVKYSDQKILSKNNKRAWALGEW